MPLQNSIVRSDPRKVICYWILTYIGIHRCMRAVIIKYFDSDGSLDSTCTKCYKSCTNQIIQHFDPHFILHENILSLLPSDRPLPSDSIEVLDEDASDDSDEEIQPIKIEPQAKYNSAFKRTTREQPVAVSQSLEQFRTELRLSLYRKRPGFARFHPVFS